MAEVLPAPSPHDGSQYFSSSPLLHSPPSQSSFFHSPSRHSISPSQLDTSRPHGHDSLQPSCSQPELRRRSSSFPSLSLNTFLPEGPDDDDEHDDNEDEIALPSYNGTDSGATLDHDNGLDDAQYADLAPVSNAPTPDTTTPLEDTEAPVNPVADDIDARQQPSRQVDYLSHEWKEEDIWSSWRHIVTRRKHYGEQSRLENASWRTWAKQKYRLRTISPETLNWLKDCDVTWLYGPLQEAHKYPGNYEATRQLKKGSPFLNKKPILKKRSVSEEMLQKSLSSSSLVKQAAAAVQAQRNSGPKVQPRPAHRLRRCASDFDGTSTYTPSTGTAADISSTLPSSTSSGVASPDTHGRKRIRFDNNVEQCIAVDFKEGGFEEEADPQWMRACSDEESDDDLPMMKTKPKKRPSINNNSPTSATPDGKGIVKLPSTTIRFHHEEPDCRGHPAALFKPLRSPALSPSPSQETLKPAKGSTRLLLNEQEDDESEWVPAESAATSHNGGNTRSPSNVGGLTGKEGASIHDDNGLHRTGSGMFMPFAEGEDDSLTTNGIFGRVVDTVNTARDICYVLYNVGWRK